MSRVELKKSNVSQRMKESKDRILKKLNSLLKKYTWKNTVDLLNWTNIIAFIEKNFTKNEILNSKQSKLIYEYNLLLTKIKKLGSTAKSIFKTQKKHNVKSFKSL